MIARQARRDMGFPDELASKLFSDGYVLTPLIPASWPPRDCTVVFYVHRAYVHWDGTRWQTEPIVARIDVDLRTGIRKSTKVMDWPGGGKGDWGGYREPRWQQPMIDAIVTGVEPSAEQLAPYVEWLDDDASAIVTWLWHREFFEWISEDHPDIAAQVILRGQGWLDRPDPPADP